MTETINQGFKEFLCLDRSAEVLLIGDRNKKGATPTKNYYGFAVVKDVKFHRDQILSGFSSATFIGNEAPLEPRWYRTPWRKELWDKMLAASFQMGNQLSVMEYAVAEGAAKGLARRAMIVSPTLERIADELMERSNKTWLLAQMMLTHENEGPLDVSKAMTTKMQTESVLKLTHQSADKIIKEVMGSLEVPEKRLALLTEDDACQLAVVLEMFRGSMRCVMDMNDVLFSQPDLLAVR